MISEEYISFFLSVFDDDLQDLILIEEMSELTQEVIKIWRGSRDYTKVIEEMAHVMISLSMCKIIYGISDEDIEKEVLKKVNKYKNKGENKNGKV